MWPVSGFHAGHIIISQGNDMVALKRLTQVLTKVLMQALPVALAIVAINFLLLQFAPGDAADVIAAQTESGDIEAIAQMRRDMGLDRPVLEQLWVYILKLAQFDLGVSARYGTPVADLIWERVPNTILLMVTAIVLALFFGVAMGTVMAFYENRLPDRILTFIALVFYSLPAFWVALMFIVLFSVMLGGLLPAGGAGSIGRSFSWYEAIFDKLRYLILPALSLGLIYLATYARLTRTAVLEVMKLDFVRAARARGIREVSVAFGHILRNALLPVTTVLGMHIGGMLSGTVVIETVYSWPGLGRLTYEAVLARDFQLLLGILLFSSFIVVVANALTDLVQFVIDPRTRARQ